jgi:hypothetical protein
MTVRTLRRKGMRRLGRWGLTVVTMVSVVTLALLLTGWGSAIAANVSSVFVTNTAASPVPVHQQGTANVNVTNTTPMPVSETNTDANGNIEVHEQGTANVAQSGTWNVGITGTPTVKSGDTATVLGQGGDVALSAGQRLTLNPDGEDVSAYREVTLYLEFVGGDFNTDTTLVSLTDDGTPYLFAFDDLNPQDLRIVKTYDPAPAKLVLQLWNNSTTSETNIDYTVVGRTN